MSIKGIGRSFAAIAATTALVTTLGGCAQQPTGSGDSSASEKFVLRVSYVESSTSPVYEELEALSERLEEKSDGALKLEIYSDGQLGTTNESIQAVSNGDDMIAYTDSASIAALVSGYGSNLSVLSGPFLLESIEEGFNFYDSDEYEKLVTEFEEESGVHVLSMNWILGQRSMIGNKAYSSPADMKNARVRVPPIDTWTRTFDLIGAVPTTIEAPEVFSALEQGVVDATESSPGGMVVSKFYEAVDQVTLTRHFMPFYGYVISQKTMDSLPEELRVLLKEEFDASGVRASENVQKLQAEHLKTMAESGVIVHEADIAAYKKATEPFYDSYPDGLAESIRKAAK